MTRHARSDRLRHRIAAAALMAIAAPSLAAAQQRAPGPPEWLPGANLNMNAGMTAAQRNAVYALLEKIERLVLQVPELARPQGFELQPHFNGGFRIPHEDAEPRDYDVFSNSFGLDFFAVSRAHSGGETVACLMVFVNPLAPHEGFGFRNRKGEEFWEELPRGEPVGPSTQVWGAYGEDVDDVRDIWVTFVSKGELPWKQATREQFYDAIHYESEVKDSAVLGEVRRSLGKTPYQEWLEGADERRRQREEILRGVAAVQTPEELAKTRKLLEDTEREVTENLRKSEADDRAANQKALSQMLRHSSDVKAERDGLTPSQLRMPALFDGTGASRLDATGVSLADRDGPDVHRLLYHNLDFFRARTSPVEVHAIAVYLRATQICMHPPIKRALWQFYRTFDWAALNALLDEPRTRQP